MPSTSFGKLGGDLNEKTGEHEKCFLETAAESSLMSDVLKRNDIKKSEAYESGYLEGTVPVYEAYMALKKVLSSVKIEEDEEEND